MPVIVRKQKGTPLPTVKVDESKFISLSDFFKRELKNPWKFHTFLWFRWITNLSGDVVARIKENIDTWGPYEEIHIVDTAFLEEAKRLATAYEEETGDEPVPIHIP